MAESTYRFRRSLGGFHRGDVTAYIEKAATQHRFELLECEKKISELQEENYSLQQQLNLLMMAPPVAAPAPVTEPAPVAEPAPIPAPVPMQEPAPATPTEAADWMQMELQAYRRAEAVERHANIRAKELYEKMEDLCVGALGDFQTADESIRQAIDVMVAQATSLEKVYQVLSAALTASREKIPSINQNYSDPDQVD